MAKIFVSHRDADAALAEQLAGDLKAAGHDVWLDTYEVRVGDSIVGKMNEGLTSADYVVLCYSTLGVEAPWIAREWMPTVARQLEGNGVRVLPAVLTSGNPPTRPPTILADIKAADLTSDWNSGVKALLAAIR